MTTKHFPTTRCVYCGKEQPPQDIIIEIDEDGVVHHPIITNTNGKLELKKDVK